MLPSTQSQRRQNTSCDPCRSSKRRCFFSSPGSRETGTACTNCKRLGHCCTFEFVKSRSGPEKKRRRGRTRSHQLVELDEPNALERPVDESTNISNAEFQSGSGSVTGQDIFAPWIDFDFDHYVEDDPTSLRSNIDIPSLAPPHLDTATTEETRSETGVSLPLSRSNMVQYSLPYNARSIIGISPNSPIHLLNSKLDATVLDERLARIHDTIITGCASRFVDYNCNLYATGCRYQLEDGASGSSGSSRDQMSVHLSPIPSDTSSKSSSVSQTNFPFLTPRQTFGETDTGESRMTMLGTVRFLDHFSDLYGNRMTAAARRQSDAVLKAVLRTFSLQWLSPSEASLSNDFDTFAGGYNGGQAESDSLTNAFHDVWSQARSLLKSTLSVRSFRVLYATLIFDGTAIPTKASGGSADSIVPHEFLDVGLQKLCHLDKLVKQYCAILGPHSTYSTLLEASLSVVRWGGYIRDIGAALTTDHRCKLPGVSKHTKASPSSGSTLDWPNYHQDLDGSVPIICQRAVAEAFCVWKQIIEVKVSVSKPTHSGITIPSSLSQIITSTITAVGRFNHLFRPFLNHCRENLEYLSIRSRTCSVSIAMFWDLGVFILAQTLHSTMRGSSLCEPNLISSTRAYQEEAVTSVARTVECVLSLPTEEIFNLQNGLSADVPILAYHITPGLMATSFQKAIENIIDLQFSPLYGMEEQKCGTPNIASDSGWERQIDIIMKGLSSLDVTIGGSQVASAAFQSLMREHGDILSECWSSDFST